MTLVSTSASLPETAATVMRRYVDAYRVARAVVAVGRLVKFVGNAIGAIGLLLFIFGFSGGFFARATGAAGPNESGISLLTLGAGLIVLLFAVLVWAVGTMMAANGETLKATLDSAVNSSPFLSDAQRAEVMSLPLA